MADGATSSDMIVVGDEWRAPWEMEVDRRTVVAVVLLAWKTVKEASRHMQPSVTSCHAW